jgi:hypothetical protein
MNVKLIDKSALPKTWKVILREFANKSLRSAVWEAAKRGSVLHVARRIALTDKSGLNKVESVLVAEWAAAGFDKFHIGDADPSIYGEGQVAAYLDQPY